MLDYNTKTFKAELSDGDAYVEFYAPTQEAIVLLTEYQMQKKQSEVVNISPILRHLSKRIVSTHGFTVDGKEPDIKDFLNWPAELVNTVLEAYFDSLGKSTDPSDKSDAEKN